MVDFDVNGITLDGINYFVRVVYKSLKRSFNLFEGGNAGIALSSRTIRDIRGTLYSYALDVEPISGHQDEYDAFYEAITAPVDYHTVKLPYGQDDITFEAQITSGEDSYNGHRDGTELWGGLTVNFIPMEPQRRPVNE